MIAAGQWEFGGITAERPVKSIEEKMMPNMFRQPTPCKCKEPVKVNEGWTLCGTCGGVLPEYLIKTKE